MKLPEGRLGWLIRVAFAVAVVVGLGVVAYLGVPIGRSEPGNQQCMRICTDAPRLGDFIAPGSSTFGFESDRGRMTFIFWNGVERPATVELGRVVHGVWTPYRVDVKFDRAVTTNENQSFAYLRPEAPQLVTMTAIGATPGTRVEARAYWQWQYIAGNHDQFYPLASAVLAEPSLH